MARKQQIPGLQRTTGAIPKSPGLVSPQFASVLVAGVLCCHSEQPGVDELGAKQAAELLCVQYYDEPYLHMRRHRPRPHHWGLWLSYRPN